MTIGFVKYQICQNVIFFEKRIVKTGNLGLPGKESFNLRLGGPDAALKESRFAAAPSAESLVHGGAQFLHITVFVDHTYIIIPVGAGKYRRDAATDTRDGFCQVPEAAWGQVLSKVQNIAAISILRRGAGKDLFFQGHLQSFQLGGILGHNVGT